MARITESVRTACADLNGILRGKRLPGLNTEKLEKDGHRLPLSALSVDIWGYDVEDSPLVFASGDADGQVRCTDRGPVPMPWLDHQAMLVPMWMYTEDGRPFECDPRHALGRVLARYQKRNWRVIASTELEFTLVKDTGPTLARVANPSNGRQISAGDVLSIEALDSFSAFFDDLYSGADTMGIALQAAISESGVGQFEVNVNHGPAMRTADDTLLLRLLVRATARTHGYAATFMPKPFPDDVGNGMHLHFSIIDERGRNIFDNGLMTGSPLLHQAVAGCLAAMPASTAIFAPFWNSYLRMSPEMHAPIGASWGYENRTTALRIPGGPAAGRRIEHRTAGGDTNPYLMMAAILGAALIGIEDGLSPPEPIVGNAYEQRVLACPSDWEDALDRWAGSPRACRIFPKQLVELFERLKRQELRKSQLLDADALTHSLVDAL